MVCDTDMILEKCADDKIIGKMSRKVIENITKQWKK